MIRVRCVGRSAKGSGFDNESIDRYDGGETSGTERVWEYHPLFTQAFDVHGVLRTIGSLAASLG